MFMRTACFAYGIAAYVVFLATFLYAIAFVGGFVVPTRLDAPLRGPLLEALAIDLALLSVFAVQHSVMARRWFKERWTRVVPPVVERSTYVLCASFALLLLMWQWRPIGVVVWFVEDTSARLVLWTLFAAGWATVLVVTFLINHFDLFGLRQVWLSLVGRPYSRITFRTPLPYRFVRHPLYLGFLLAFWMTPTMTLAHLVFALATTAYIVLAIQFEERDLVAEHGASYERYRQHVPMILPWRAPLAAAVPAGHVPAAERAGRGVTAVLLALGALTVSVSAQGQPPGATTPQVGTGHGRPPSSDFLATVREATARFKDVTQAEAEGYALMFGCVSGPDWGAMGLHYVNLALVGDGVLDPARPEIVIYEPLPNGRLRLTGADFLVLAADWHAGNPATPQLGGQLLHLFESPNRFGLPDFYTLHVWAWKDNPAGMYSNWHSKVSCEAFSRGAAR